jgi:2-polyprenyl-3-methyl-5-hydroxy-6-metoxy-1,4-benzoquinol methylase
MVKLISAEFWNNLMRSVLLYKLKLLLYFRKLSKLNKHRTLVKINEDYEDGVWSRNHDPTSIISMYEGEGDRQELMVEGNHLFFGNIQEKYSQYLNQIIDNLKQYKHEKIVELGCGKGGLLFELNKNGFNSLQGFDLSKNAIKTAKDFAVKNDINIDFEVLDITKKIPNLDDSIIITHTCLEQLKNYMPLVIKNMINANPKLVINFEVDYENCSYFQKKYMDSKDFQNNLITELINHKIKIIKREKFNFGLKYLNQPSVTIWKP